MFSHVMVGSNDIERSRKSYDAVLGVIEEGTSIEEPPGSREEKLGVLHLAYVRDPDGNELCALPRPS
jgi:catechol 2,3-dioxygenase-like lactoylglutathione lyase family enzyme